MNLNLDSRVSANYKNNSQITRVVTENWAAINAYCPRCGHSLSKFENNRPVADFYCPDCFEEFELKSKHAESIGGKIVDGAYKSMIERISSSKNPNFFFLTYNRDDMVVINFMIIPKFFFVHQIIEKRKPLSSEARRAGWVGCNILLSTIPESGRIFFVDSRKIVPKERVLKKWERVFFLKNFDNEGKSWLIDVMNCVEKTKKQLFYLSDIYSFEPLLKERHPNNHFVKDKIRQQLQILRDRGFIEFLGNGKYRKIV